MSLSDWLRSFGAASPFDPESKRPKPGGQVFIPFADATEADWSSALHQADKVRRQEPSSVFCSQADPASMPGGAFTGLPLAASMPTPPVGSERTPYRGLDGGWHDGTTGRPLTAAEAGRWGVPMP